MERKNHVFPEPSELKKRDVLSDPLEKPDGGRVSSPSEWEEQRAYLKELLAHYLYGRLPLDSGKVSGRVLERLPLYGGKALRERVEIACGPEGAIAFTVYIFRPNRPGRFPVVTWNSFQDMQTCPVEEEAVVGRGYVLAMFQKTQLAPDRAGAPGGIYGYYPDHDFKAVAAWAWGHSRVIDYLAATDYADMAKLVATGHSRGGKAALCAGIYDERIALTVPNNSGCGGCGYLRVIGDRNGPSTPAVCETAGRMAHVFPYWFSPRFAAMSATEPPHEIDREFALPYDMHTLKALIAPRALLSTEGLDDAWANPYGTRLTHEEAKKVFDFLGVPEKIDVKFREGGHMQGAEDWLALLDFADKVL